MPSFKIKVDVKKKEKDPTNTVQQTNNVDRFYTNTVYSN